MFSFLKELNPFQQAPKVVFTERSFGEQALLNKETMEQLKDPRMLRFIDARVTATRLANLKRIDTTQMSTLHYDGNAYKKNANDYLNLETDVVFHTLKLLNAIKHMPHNVKASMDDFDLTKIKISDISAVPPQTDPKTQERRDAAVNNIHTIVAKAQSFPAPGTAYFGPKSYFDYT